MGLLCCKEWPGVGVSPEKRNVGMGLEGRAAATVQSQAEPNPLVPQIRTRTERALSKYGSS